MDFLKIDRTILSDLSDDPVLNAIEKFSHHDSVLKTKKVLKTFVLVTIEGICKEIPALDASKATQSNEIPNKIIKNKSDIFSKFSQANVKQPIETSTFPEQLKDADVKPVSKKDFETDEKNYRPISILPTVSKIYKRCLNKQLDEYFLALLSKYHFGFRKDYSVINFFLTMIEKW